jgi:UTP--glucose-1-phosphate uridylyltransferase
LTGRAIFAFLAGVEDLDDATRALLDAFGFDERQFAELRARLRDGAAGAGRNQIAGVIAAPAPSDRKVLPPRGSAERAALDERGLRALRAGEVGCVVLAGGMATRFGGVVKACVDCLPGRSFLALKLADIRRTAEQALAPVPVLMMSSFATDADLRLAVEREHSPLAPVEVFAQFVSLRLAPDGTLFRDAAGRPSPYAPGHGDLTFALVQSGALERFLAAGGRTLLMSNVDNLAATLDPAVIGAHLDAGAEMTVEVVARRKGDPGGAPLRVDGKLQIVEDFRLPRGFDRDSLPVFNTNTFVLDAEALRRDLPLTWFAVKKEVDGREAIQFEHLVGELSVHLECALLEVPREGAEARFLPVKDPEELARRLPEIEAVLRARGVV